MKFTPPLDKMSVEEKLRLMDEIWADLSRDPDSIPIPEWHLEVLREREQLVKEGKAEYIDLEAAMKDVEAIAARDADLRKYFHGEIDRLSPAHLALLHRVLLQLRILETTESLNREFDAEIASGNWTPEQIAKTVREVRAARKHA